MQAKKLCGEWLATNEAVGGVMMCLASTTEP